MNAAASRLGATDARWLKSGCLYVMLESFHFKAFHSLYKR